MTCRQVLTLVSEWVYTGLDVLTFSVRRRKCRPHSVHRLFQIDSPPDIYTREPERADKAVAPDSTRTFTSTG